MLTTTHAQETVETTTGSSQSSTIINAISTMDRTSSSLPDEDQQTGKCVSLFNTSITRALSLMKKGSQRRCLGVGGGGGGGRLREKDCNEMA